MPGADRPNSRERYVLEKFCGEPEPASKFAGVGPATWQALLAKGWVVEVPDHPDSEGEMWYAITDAGEDALGR